MSCPPLFGQTELWSMFGVSPPRRRPQKVRRTTQVAAARAQPRPTETECPKIFDPSDRRQRRAPKPPNTSRRDDDVREGPKDPASSRGPSAAEADGNGEPPKSTTHRADGNGEPPNPRPIEPTETESPKTHDTSGRRKRRAPKARHIEPTETEPQTPYPRYATVTPSPPSCRSPGR